MKIAIPTQDRITLYKRTGRTKEFAIYDVIDGSVTFAEFRINPHAHVDDEKGNHEHTHDDVLAVLKDCDALLVHTVGTHFRQDFDKANFPIYKTKQTDLKEIISVFAQDMLRHKRI